MPVRNGMENPGIASNAVPTTKLERPVPMVHCQGPNERDYAYVSFFYPSGPPGFALDVLLKNRLAAYSIGTLDPLLLA
jgi:hypothetical protein